MWYLWEASNNKFNVVCEMREMDPWKMPESKEGDPDVGKRFCDLELVKELYKEVETVRDF